MEALKELILNGSPDVVVPALVFICGAFIAVSCTVSVQWYKLRKAQSEAMLKRDMIARGFTADEIVKVLRATAEESTEGPVAEIAAPAVPAQR